MCLLGRIVLWRNCLAVHGQDKELVTVVINETSTRHQHSVYQRLSKRLSKYQESNNHLLLSLLFIKYNLTSCSIFFLCHQIPTNDEILSKITCMSWLVPTALKMLRVSSPLMVSSSKSTCSNQQLKCHESTCSNQLFQKGSWWKSVHVILRIFIVPCIYIWKRWSGPVLLLSATFLCLMCDLLLIFHKVQLIHDLSLADRCDMSKEHIMNTIEIFTIYNIII